MTNWTRSIFDGISLLSNGKLNRKIQIRNFTSSKAVGVFGCTEDATEANLPAQFSPGSAFKTIELRPEGELTPGLNTAEYFDDIEQYGFHITDAHYRITEQVIHSNKASQRIHS